MNGATYSLKLTLNSRFLWSFFMAILFTLRVFTRNHTHTLTLWALRYLTWWWYELATEISYVFARNLLRECSRRIFFFIFRWVGGVWSMVWAEARLRKLHTCSHLRQFTYPGSTINVKQRSLHSKKRFSVAAQCRNLLIRRLTTDVIRKCCYESVQADREQLWQK